jgi:hypothetical protein
MAKDAMNGAPDVLVVFMYGPPANADLWREAGLPHQLYSVVGEGAVSAEDGERFGDGLGYE